MHFSRLIATASLLSSSVLAFPPDEHLIARQSRPDNHTLNRERADAVKAAFEFAWSGYKEYAFPHDELKPVSNSYSDSRNGWGASAIDAFSTALVMQIPDIVDTILEYIPTINYDISLDDAQVSLFETTIRYLGGMLSGYDFLKGPLSNLASNATAIDQILVQAERLAGNLAFAFDTPTGIPSNNLYLNPQGTDNSTTNGLATIGTLVMEWTHLSDLTGNATYGALAQKGESYLLAPQPASSEPFPGLVGTNVDINTGLFQDAEGGWVGGDDSFYEYLIKMFVYDSTRFASYRDRWILAADSTITYLASHPSTRPDLTFVAMFDGEELIFESEHRKLFPGIHLSEDVIYVWLLVQWKYGTCQPPANSTTVACFNGGNFILGGLVLKEQKYIDFGLALVNGCHDTYVSTLTGIGPEVFKWVTNTTAANDTNNPPPPVDQEAFYKTAGFYISDSDYILRPEVIESFYYAYRATGDQIYRDWAWAGFVAINATCVVGSGFSEISDVNAVDGGSFLDFQDSFLFAEVLKYSYLIHAPDNVWQVEHDGENQWVYNTEAHPFKVWGPPI